MAKEEIKKISERKKRGNYEDKIPIKGSFLDIVKAVVKDADKRAQRKRKMRLNKIPILSLLLIPIFCWSQDTTSRKAGKTIYPWNDTTRRVKHYYHSDHCGSEPVGIPGGLNDDIDTLRKL